MTKIQNKTLILSGDEILEYLIEKDRFIEPIREMINRIPTDIRYDNSDGWVATPIVDCYIWNGFRDIKINSFKIHHESDDWVKLKLSTNQIICIKSGSVVALSPIRKNQDYLLKNIEDVSINDTVERESYSITEGSWFMTNLTEDWYEFIGYICRGVKKITEKEFKFILYKGSEKTIIDFFLKSIGRKNISVKIKEEKDLVSLTIRNESRSYKFSKLYHMMCSEWQVKKITASHRYVPTSIHMLDFEHRLMFLKGFLSSGYFDYDGTTFSSRGDTNRVFINSIIEFITPMGIDFNIDSSRNDNDEDEFVIIMDNSCFRPEFKPNKILSGKIGIIAKESGISDVGYGYEIITDKNTPLLANFIEI